MHRSPLPTRSILAVAVALSFLAPACSTFRPGGKLYKPWEKRADAEPPYTPLTPPDGVWQKNESGEEYFITKIDKKLARRIDEKIVKSVWGFTLDVVSEDDQYFYYKYYKVDPVVSPEVMSAANSRAEKEIRDTFKTDTKVRSRLTWTSFGAGLPTSGQWRDGFAVADMNKDGHLDIVHGSVRKHPGPPSIFLGDGKGNWTKWDAKFPDLDYDYGDAKVADFDGDGNLDIALAAHLKGEAVLFGDGKGGFKDASFGLDRGPESFSSRALAIVDWNQDGRPDVLALGEGPAGPKQRQRWSQGVVAFLNGGDGTWLRQDSSERSPLFGSSIAIGDFDGDGKPDFVVGSSILGRKDLLGMSSGGGDWKPTEIDALRPGSFIWSVSVADMDQDGRPDIVVAYAAFAVESWFNGIDVLYSRPAGWERKAVSSLETGKVAHGPVAVATGDIDGDKRPDIAAITDKGEIQIFMNRGPGSFTQEKQPPVFPGSCRGSSIALTDLDGDGRAELVASFGDEDCPSEGGIGAWKASVVKSWFPW